MCGLLQIQQKKKGPCSCGYMEEDLQPAAAQRPHMTEKRWQKKESCLFLLIIGWEFLDSMFTRNSAVSRRNMHPEIMVCSTSLQCCDGFKKIFQLSAAILETLRLRDSQPVPSA